MVNSGKITNLKIPDGWNGTDQIEPVKIANEPLASELKLREPELGDPFTIANNSMGGIIDACDDDYWYIGLKRVRKDIRFKVSQFDINGHGHWVIDPSDVEPIEGSGSDLAFLGYDQR